MNWRPGKRPEPLRVAGDPAIQGGFHGHLVQFLDWMGARAFSAHTIKARRIELG